MTEKLFTVPDVYTDFKCKAGECRCSCCHGWHITISMEEYYSLLGLECSPETRRKLDSGIFRLDNPTRERFAEFAKTYTGDCPLHGDDGLCMLQCSNGEDVLPNVCRYYPRSPKTLHADECALSVSCEGVCELLLRKHEPIEFVEKSLKFAYELPEKTKDFISEYYSSVRKCYIELMQMRDFSISDRLSALVDISEILSPAFALRKKEAVEEAIERCREYRITKKESAIDFCGVTEVIRIINRIKDRFPIEEYAKRLEGLTEEKYSELSDKLSRAFPNLEVMLEQILVNHIFYTGFPFAEKKESIYLACASLTAMYAVWAVLSVVYLDENYTLEAFADITSDMFKMSEDSNFYLCVASLLHESGFDKKENLTKLLSV